MPLRPGALIALAATLVMAGACGGGGGDREPTVLAAASLSEVLPEIDPGARHAFGGSGELAAQIREGAPADVYVAADLGIARALAGEGLVERPRPLARNRLVVVARPGAAVRRVGDLTRPGVRLVLGARGVPAGDYARTALRRLGLDRALDRVVSEEPDVTSVAAKVALGEADAGIVYATDVAAVADRVRVVAVAGGAQPDIRYGVAIVRDSARAREYVARLLGPAGRGALVAAGFAPP